MQSFIALAAIAGVANAWGNYSSPAPTGTGSAPEVTYTEVVTAYTTYCPGPTSVVQGNQTYTATSVSLNATRDESAILERQTTNMSY